MTATLTTTLSDGRKFYAEEAGFTTTWLRARMYLNRTRAARVATGLGSRGVSCRVVGRNPYYVQILD